MRKYQMVEAVVLTVCAVFEIDDWRLLQRNVRFENVWAAKLFIIKLISEITGCSCRETHYYFPMYKDEKGPCSAGTTFRQRLEYNSSEKRKYDLCKKKISEYYVTSEKIAA